MAAAMLILFDVMDTHFVTLIRCRELSVVFDADVSTEHLPQVGMRTTLCLSYDYASHMD